MTQTTNCAIVIPAYNSAGTIAETLDSIQRLHSELDRISQIVVIDDCSTDETALVAARTWRLAQPPLRIIRNTENLGERESLNRGIRGLPQSTEWVFILHADDLARDLWLVANYRAMDAADARVGAITSSYDVLFADGRMDLGEDLGEERKVHVEANADSVRGTIMRGCWFKISSCCLKMEAFEELQGFQSNLPQLGDWEYTLRMLSRGWSIDYIPLRLSVYRQLKGSVSSVSFQKHRDVEEALHILSCYGQVLTFVDILRLHIWYVRSLLRRFATSILRTDISRARAAVQLIPQVVGSWWRLVSLRHLETPQ